MALTLYLEAYRYHSGSVKHCTSLRGSSWTRLEPDDKLGASRLCMRLCLTTHVIDSLMFKIF